MILSLGYVRGKAGRTRRGPGAAHRYTESFKDRLILFKIPRKALFYNEPVKQSDGRMEKMAKTRQQILILHLSTSDLDSRTVAWALYDGAKAKGERQMQTGDEDQPPYESVLDAMRDGWNVIQIPSLPLYRTGFEHDLGHLPYEYVLERKVTIDE